MRSGARLGPWVLILALVLVGAAASQRVPEVDDGIDVYFRSTGVLALSDQGRARYPVEDPGESELLERAFPDAPPQIPHSVEEMLPIALGDNECLECHDPENAGEDDIPFPESHLSRPVIAEGPRGSPMASVVKAYRKGDDLVGARYLCSTCHTPQAKNVRTPKTRFIREKVAK